MMTKIVLVFLSLLMVINADTFYRYLNIDKSTKIIIQNPFLLSDENYEQFNVLFDNLNKQENMVMCNGTFTPYKIKIGFIQEYSSAEEYWGFTKSHSQYVTEFQYVAKDMFQYFSNDTCCTNLMIIISRHYSFLSIIHDNNYIFDKLTRHFIDHTLIPITQESIHFVDKGLAITQKVVDKLTKST